MGRHSRRRRSHRGHVPLDDARLRGLRRTEQAVGGQRYTVGEVRGSEKTYRCPGCNQLIGAGTVHVVAWPAEHLMGEAAALAERRHWHRWCWQHHGRA